MSVYEVHALIRRLAFDQARLDSLIASENDYPLSSDTLFEEGDTQSKSLKLKDDGLLIRPLDG